MTSTQDSEPGPQRRIYAVIRSARPGAWDASQSHAGQSDWTGHKTYMDGLVSEGFVIMGGPLGGTDDALLIVRASDEAEIEERFAKDPWSTMLTVSRITPWNLLLGEMA